MPLKVTAFALILIMPQLLFAKAPHNNLSAERPKMRVAVSKFGATDRFAQAYGGWDIGGGLAAQLVTELIKTGRVTVVERAILSKVLMEQELSEANLVAPITRAPSGQLLGVDYLIVGEVTEFEERQMGAGMAAGFLGIKTSGDINAAHVGIDMRLVDTRTGEILYSHRAQGKAWEKAFGAKINYKIIDFGGDAFHKTPLGVATRKAIGNAVQFILNVIDKQVENFSWLGLVIESDGSDIYFNAGSDKNVAIGDRLVVSAIKKILNDPETNQMIGVIENTLGYAKVAEVDKKYAKAHMSGGFIANAGDVVRFADKSKEVVANSDDDSDGYDVME